MMEPQPMPCGNGFAVSRNLNPNLVRVETLKPLGRETRMQDGPIWLCMTPMARLDAGIGEKQLLQHGVGQIGIQRAGDPRRLATS